MHMKRSKQLHRRFWGDDAKRFHLHLHSLTDRIEVFNLSKIPLHTFPSCTWGSICLRLSAMTEHPTFLFLKCDSWRIATVPTSSPTHRADGSVGEGVVLIEVCLDYISSTSGWHRNFFQPTPAGSLVSWYYSWRKQSLWGKVSSCW